MTLLNVYLIHSLYEAVNLPSTAVCRIARDIQEALKEHVNIGRTEVCCYPGAGFERAITRALPTIRENKPNHIIVMAGICDITTRDPRTGMTSIRHHTKAGIVKYAMAGAHQAQSIIKNETKSTISFATVSGLDLADYNNRRRKHMTDTEYEEYCTTRKITHPEQDLLNSAIVTLNQRIVELNISNGAPTTWTAGAVHAYFKNSHHHYYRRLRDGCHPDPSTTARWARQIARTIRQLQQHS